MRFESPKAHAPGNCVFGRRSAVGKAGRGTKMPLAKKPVIRCACREVVEALEQRQLLSGTGWTVSYWADNTYAGTDGTPPNYVVQDNGLYSGGTVKDLSGNTVNDAIN